MKPIIQCITNNVTINDCANAVLLSGASPIMSHLCEEASEVQSFASGLLLNLGATDDYEAMKIALAVAKEKGHPVVIDPVGVAGIRYRQNFLKQLLAIGGITCIRGNYKEIEAIATDKITGYGLDYDSRYQDKHNDGKTCNTNAGSNNNEARIEVDALISHMNEYSKKTGIILAASGTTDIICDGRNVTRLSTGDEMMSSVTGSGCMLSAILASRLTYNNCAYEVVSVFEKYGDAGKRAADKTREQGLGIGTFHVNFLDELSLTEWERKQNETEI